jgi:dCMP deaminase
LVQRSRDVEQLTAAVNKRSSSVDSHRGIGFQAPPRYTARTSASGGTVVGQQRSSWDQYFMDIARQVATRATCDRKHVGALLVRDRTILSTGYNGSIRGLPHCDDVGHMMENGHCVATVHAEANAIIQAAKNGVRIDGATIYTTASPCWPCFKLIANSGCTRIVFGEFYRDPRIFEYAAKIGLELTGLGEAAQPPEPR